MGPDHVLLLSTAKQTNSCGLLRRSDRKTHMRFPKPSKQNFIKNHLCFHVIIFLYLHFSKTAINVHII